MFGFKRKPKPEPETDTHFDDPCPMAECLESTSDSLWRTAQMVRKMPPIPFRLTRKHGMRIAKAEGELTDAYTALARDLMK